MLYVIDNLKTRPFENGEFTKRCPIVYFHKKDESILTNLFQRHYRPHQEYQKLLPQVYKQLSFPSGVEADWNQYAGCDCPCSPGFLLTFPDDFSYQQDIVVTVTLAKEQLSNQIVDGCKRDG
jgi:hypothetical protein